MDMYEREKLLMWKPYFPNTKISIEQLKLLESIGGIWHYYDGCTGEYFLGNESATITWAKLADRWPYRIYEYMLVMQQTYLE